MVKKFIIAVDSQVPSFSNDNIRMFMFSKDTMQHNTIEEAEKALEFISEKNTNTFYCIIPIYVKEK